MTGRPAGTPRTLACGSHAGSALAHVAGDRTPDLTESRCPPLSGVACLLVEGEGIDLSDRVELDDLLTRYATAIDGLDWRLLDTVFNEDAHLDYRSAGGIEGLYPEVRRWLAEVLPLFDVTQHLVVNREFTRVADGVQARSCFLNANRLHVDGKPWLFTVGGRYHDRLTRTDDGWRIAARVEHTLWWDNPMPGLADLPPTVSGLPAR